jgi:hypothetical protein
LSIIMRNIKKLFSKLDAGFFTNKPISIYCVAKGIRKN